MHGTKLTHFYFVKIYDFQKPILNWGNNSDYIIEDTLVIWHPTCKNCVSAKTAVKHRTEETSVVQSQEWVHIY